MQVKRVSVALALPLVGVGIAATAVAGTASRANVKHPTSQSASPGSATNAPPAKRKRRRRNNSTTHVAGKRQSTAAKPTTTLGEVVVTGAPTYNGVTRKNASFSVTVADRERIKIANPTSVADLLKLSPGVYPESSGGQGGNNVEVAGFPTGGGTQFVTFQLDGMPFFPKPLGFSISMVRTDESIRDLTMLQSGPSVLYGNGQPGLIGNFSLRTGTAEPHGDIAATALSEGGMRFDGFYGAELGHSGWFGSVGGFWINSHGVRNPQYPANKGGQITMTLSHDLDHGSVLFFARRLREHDQWVTDTPTLNPSTGTFKSFPGFSALTGTFGSAADSRLAIQQDPCSTPGCTPGVLNWDLQRGRGADINMFGARLNLHGDRWSLFEGLQFLNGFADENAFLSTVQNPITLQEFVNKQEAASGLPTDLPITTHFTVNNESAPLNQIVAPQMIDYIATKPKSVSNSTRFSLDLGDNNTLTLGTYLAFFSVDQRRIYHGTDVLLQAKTNPSPINVSVADGSTIYQITAPNGTYSNGGADTPFTYHAETYSLFLDDSWHIGNFYLDGGVRVEHDHQKGYVFSTMVQDLDNDPRTLYNNTGEVISHAGKPLTFAKTATAQTIGASYSINDHSSVYARESFGVSIPTFDLVAGLPGIKTERVKNLQVGYKYENRYVFVNLDAYRMLFYNSPLVQIIDNKTQVSTFGARTNGLNFAVTTRPIKGLQLQLSGDYMDGRYVTNVPCTSVQTISGTVVCQSFAGKRLMRQPKFQYLFTPMYTMNEPWGNLRFWLSYRYVGYHYGDQLNGQPLGLYYTFDGGIQANIGKHWQTTLRGTNLTNNIGMTEGNGAVVGVATTNDVILGRSIDGREVNLQVKYRF